MDLVDCVVVGAGVVGLAVAREAALRGLETIVVEGEGAIGTGTSSRNSEVIHAGLYYPTGTLKARLCVEGRERLYRYCEERGIAHRRCGKLVVAASDAEAGELQRLCALGTANGVRDLAVVDANAVARLEPALRAAAALVVPASGIVDSHAFMASLLGDLEAAGGMLAVASRVVGIRRDGGAWVVRTVGVESVEGREGETGEVAARRVVNAAGLGAQRLAARTEGTRPHGVPPLYRAKGNYFALAGRSPFDRLVYPVPEPGGLGVHCTIDLGGQARFGPDVEWLDGGAPADPHADAEAAIDYAVDPARRDAFAAAIRRYWPGLDAERLAPTSSGVRPKVSGPGAPASDFVVRGPREHGGEGLVELFGIESPGLTASLALAALVVDRLGER